MPRFADYPSSTAPNNGDLLVIKDVVSNTTKNITRENILKGTPLPADTVDTQAIGDGEVTAPKIDFGGAGSGVWWEEIARTTLGVAGDTITVSSIPNRKYLKFIINTIPSGQTIHIARFNNDSGNNYANRESTNGAAEVTQTSQPNLPLADSAATTQAFIEMLVKNVATQEKMVLLRSTRTGAAGAGNLPSRRELTGKWANTTDAINRFDLVNTGTGDYAIGSEVVVLGHD